MKILTELVGLCTWLAKITYKFVIFVILLYVGAFITALTYNQIMLIINDNINLVIYFRVIGTLFLCVICVGIWWYIITVGCIYVFRSDARLSFQKIEKKLVKKLHGSLPIHDTAIFLPLFENVNDTVAYRANLLYKIYTKNNNVQKILANIVLSRPSEMSEIFDFVLLECLRCKNDMYSFVAQCDDTNYDSIKRLQKIKHRIVTYKWVTNEIDVINLVIDKITMHRYFTEYDPTNPEPKYIQNARNVGMKVITPYFFEQEYNKNKQTHCHLCFRTFDKYICKLWCNHLFCFECVTDFYVRNITELNTSDIKLKCPLCANKSDLTLCSLLCNQTDMNLLQVRNYEMENLLRTEH